MGGAGVGVKGVFNNVKNCKIGRVGHPLHEPVISFDFSQCFDVICVTIRIERRPIVTFGHWYISHLFTLNDNYGHYFSFRLTRRVDIIFFAIQVEFKDQQHYTKSSRNHNWHNSYLLASSFRWNLIWSWSSNLFIACCCVCVLHRFIKTLFYGISKSARQLYFTFW